VVTAGLQPAARSARRRRGDPRQFVRLDTGKTRWIKEMKGRNDAILACFLGI
jgi:hypothetical protein